MANKHSTDASRSWPEGGLPHGEHPYDYGYGGPDFGEAPPADPVLCLVTGTHWYRWILIDPDTDTVIGYFAKQEAAVAELVSRVGYLPDEEAE